MMNVLDKIQYIVNRNPNLIAYEINNECINYQELWNRAYY